MDPREANRLNNVRYRARLRAAGLSSKTGTPLRMFKGWPRHLVALRHTLFGDGCWTYQGRRDDNGYGRVARQGGSGDLMAHRVIYEALVGPIPDGLTLDHLCLNTSCVNPAHLEPVTRSENSRRIRALEKATA